ncbi:MAG: hypothetical protein IJU69_00240 [Bacteroidales bacterium]|nr:hypothetical protein [Bacteroidales bacterium]
MNTEEITTIKLTPSKGHWLTPKTLEDENQRWFSDSIYLGKNDSADNYEEWTERRKRQWESEHQPEPDGE